MTKGQTKDKQYMYAGKRHLVQICLSTKLARRSI